MLQYGTRPTALTPDPAANLAAGPTAGPTARLTAQLKTWLLTWLLAWRASRSFLSRVRQETFLMGVTSSRRIRRGVQDLEEVSSR